MNHIWKDTPLATSMKRRARVFTLRRKLSNSLRKKYEWWNIYITPLRGGRYAGTNYIKKYSKDEKPPQKICSVLVNLVDEKSIEFASKLMHYTSESLDEALIHGGISNNVKVNLKRIDSENLKAENIKPLLKEVTGVLIPGGFGKRGTEGKIAAIKYARLNNIPFFGICFGMQMAVIEAARNLLNIKNASTSEFGNNCTPVVGLLDEWQKGKKKIKGTEKNLGGTMRLGLYDAILKNNSFISKIYSKKKIKERHRHRYEVNIKYKNDFEKKGLIFSALSPDGSLPEIIELRNHPWFVGVQFHPEFKSRPFTPHPLFSSFVKAAGTNERKN